jgi:hypothetical protein
MRVKLLTLAFVPYSSDIAADRPIFYKPQMHNEFQVRANAFREICIMILLQLELSFTMYKEKTVHIYSCCTIARFNIKGESMLFLLLFRFSFDGRIRFWGFVSSRSKVG